MFVCITLGCLAEAYTSPSVYEIGCLGWRTTVVNGQVVYQNPLGLIGEISLVWGIEDAKAAFGLLPNTQVSVECIDHQLQEPVAVDKMIEWRERNITLVVGNPTSDISTVTGIIGAVYGMAQFSGTATAVVLSDDVTYPYFTRLVASASKQVAAIINAILFYYNSEGRGWENIAVIFSTDPYGISLYNALQNQIPSELNIATDQSVISGQDNYEVEFREIRNSGARVVVAFLFDGWAPLITAAYEDKLIGPQYVWFGTDTVNGLPIYLDDAGQPIQEVVDALQGFFGSITLVNPTPPFYDSYLARWKAAINPATEPPAFSTIFYDLGVLTAVVLGKIDAAGLLGPNLSPELLTEVAVNTTLIGASGPIGFAPNGDRITGFVIRNFNSTSLTWNTVGVNFPNDTYVMIAEPAFQDGTTNVPDLDIRPPFAYWSCHDRESGYDETGKTISLATPDGSDINEIDSTYRCDGFIDCKNLSDEGGDCETNYMILFIVFGIVTGLLILAAILLIPFVIIFGCCFKRKRVRAASPIFLLILIISCIMGLISTYAWYGKPHSVGCGFQPWLLGLAVTSVLAVLCSKSFRIWRIFKSPFDRVIITDVELLVLWVLIMIPALIILTIWTIVSTPAAKLEERDGEDHWVCTTGGFTGTPGGLVFFFILVGYLAIIVAFALFLTVVTRRVPTLFNESKLVGISIFHLAFLSVVVIPIVLVLNEFDPFISWIIRTLAIIYAFAATLVLQFVPKIVGIIFVDKCAEYKAPKIQMRGSHSLNITNHSQTVD